MRTAHVLGFLGAAQAGEAGRRVEGDMCLQDVCLPVCRFGCEIFAHCWGTLVRCTGCAGQGGLGAVGQGREAGAHQGAPCPWETGGTRVRVSTLPLWYRWQRLCAAVVPVAAPVPASAVCCRGARCALLRAGCVSSSLDGQSGVRAVQRAGGCILQPAEGLQRFASRWLCVQLPGQPKWRSCSAARGRVHFTACGGAAALCLALAGRPAPWTAKVAFVQCSAREDAFYSPRRGCSALPRAGCVSSPLDGQSGICAARGRMHLTAHRGAAARTFSRG